MNEESCFVAIDRRRSRVTYTYIGSTLASLSVRRARDHGGGLTALTGERNWCAARFVR